MAFQLIKMYHHIGVPCEVHWKTVALRPAQDAELLTATFTAGTVLGMTTLEAECITFYHVVYYGLLTRVAALSDRGSDTFSELKIATRSLSSNGCSPVSSSRVKRR